MGSSDYTSKMNGREQGCKGNMLREPMTHRKFQISQNASTNPAQNYQASFLCLTSL